MSRKTRKLIWSAPLLAMFAVVGALAIFMTLAPNGAQAHDVELPGIVTGVTAEADGRNTIDVEWTAPADGGAVEYYRIDRSEDGDNWMRLVEMHTGSTSITDMMGLKPNKTYHYRVFGVNAAGTGPSSDLTAHSMATTDDSGRPGVVRMLTGKVMGPNQINLSWYPPEENGGASVTRYCINTAPSGTALTDIAAANCAGNIDPTDDASEAFNDAAGGTAPTGVIVIRAPMGDGKVEFTHEKLPASHSRTYEVYAANSKGFSTAATAVAPVPQTDAPGKPSKPTLRAVATSTTAVDLFWTWPADNGGAAITTFDVDTKVGSAAWDSADGDIEATNNDQAGAGADAATAQDSQTIAGNDTFSYRVRANNGTKDSDWSNIVMVTTKDDPANPGTTILAVATPAAATGHSASHNEFLRQIDLKWTDLGNTSYLIDVRKGADGATDGAGSWMVLQENTGYTRSTYNHRNLQPDTDPDDVVGTEPANDYAYRLFPLSNGAYGPPVVFRGSTKAATKPAQVRGLRTSSDDPTMIDLEWAKPTDDGGQPITGYRVEIGLDNTWPETSALPVTHMSEKCGAITETNREDYVCVREVEGADTTTFTLGGLDAGNVRWFRVYAINKVSRADTGDSDAANNFPDTDDDRNADPKKGTSAKSGTPGMPLDLTVQPARDANEDDPTKLGIDILWNAPDDPAGDSVTGYVIARRTKDSTDADWSAWDEDWLTIPRSDSNFLHTHDTDTDEPDNLANGEMRQYRVTAKSGAGSGPTTGVVTYPTPEYEHTHNAAPTTVGTIADVTITVGDTHTSEMAASSYFDDADADDTLTITASSDDPAVATVMINADGMIVVEGMAAGPATITVTASDGMDSVDQTFMVTVNAAPPELMAPTNVRVNPVGSGGVIVAWDLVAHAHGYRIIAINVNDVEETHSEFVNNPMATSGGLDGLTPGQTYNIFVASFDDADPPSYRLQSRFRQIVAE